MASLLNNGFNVRIGPKIESDWILCSPRPFENTLRSILKLDAFPISELYNSFESVAANWITTHAIACVVDTTNSPRAREEESEQSDLDLLYCLRDEFYSRYPGWDLANRESLNRVGKKYILGETVYVA